MQTKKLLYAAVGAPIAAAKTAQARVEEIREKLAEGAGTLSKDLESQLDEWAREGEELLGKIGDSKAVEELSERMDLDQVQEQVTKLRDQIEDLLDSWRTNFRPERTTEVVQVEVETVPAETPAGGKPAAEKPAAAENSNAAKGPAAAKKPAAKKPVAKKPTSDQT